MSRTHRSSVRVVLAALAATAFVAACAKKEAAPDTAAADTTAMMAPAPAPAAPNDAQIAHVAVSANSIDSAAGELAKTKGSSAAVKEFAQMMITDHTGVNKQAVALATKLNVTPEDNDISRGLKAGADSSNTSLGTKSGADFDHAYIEHEVAYHQAVLDALDRTLIPGAQNAELKSLLETVRPAVAAHLERAKAIQTSLGH